MSVSQLLRQAVQTKAIDEETFGNENFEDVILAGELSEIQKDLDESAMLLDVANQTEAQLSALVAGIEALTEESPLTAREAALMNMAVEGIAAPWGGSEALGMQVAGVESFEEVGGRATATTYGLEGIKDGISAVWTAIKDFIKKSVQAVKMFFTKHFALVGRVIKRAKSLEEKAKAISSDFEQKEKTLEIGMTASYMAKGGKLVPDLAKAIKDDTNVLAFINKSNGFAGMVKKLLTPVTAAKPTEDKAEEEKSIGELEKGFADFVDAIVKVSGASNAFTNDAMFSKGADGKSIEALRGAEFLGEKAFVMGFDASEEGTVEEIVSRSVSSMKFGFMQFAEAPLKVKSDTKVPALAKDDIVALCEAAGALAEAVYENKDKNKDAEELEKVIDKAGEELTKVAKAATGTVKGWAVGKIGTRMLRKLGSQLLRPTVDLVNHCTKVANAGLIVADKSISNYQKPAKKDA